MAQERSIEVKVGVLILVSLGILAGFILVMGGLNFEKTYTLYVDFDNPGGLQSGAPVRVAGAQQEGAAFSTARPPSGAKRDQQAPPDKPRARQFMPRREQPAYSRGSEEVHAQAPRIGRAPLRDARFSMASHGANCRAR